MRLDENFIEKLMEDYVLEYKEVNKTKTKWGKPIIAYADASDELFNELKIIVSKSHATPEELLTGARTVVTYFIPFCEEVVKSNILGKGSSKEWAIAYIETNKLIEDLNSHLKASLEKHGHTATTTPATHNFDSEKLISDWSHRHVAYIGGLGKFGLNNMLITSKGCCGRVGSIITDLKISKTTRTDGENCLYYSKGICKKCVDRCVNKALKEDGFDRHKCYEMCLFNAKLHSDIELSDVCGKCLVGLPCSTKNPLQNL
ncbi:MAG: epoxyqueuosine reductase [Clostridium sp.]